MEAKPYSKQGLHIAASRCNQCIFSVSRIVSDVRAEEILAACDREEHFFECHKSTIRGEPIVCAGYAESVRRNERTNQAVQVADRLGFVHLVDPETGSAARKQR